MFFRNTRAWRWFVAALIVTSFIPALTLRPSAQTEHQSAAARDEVPAAKKGLSREQRAREMWLRHELNRQRLEREHPLGAEALTTDVINQDVNDISVIQGDNRVIAPPTPFDLNGRAVQFTPAGSSYTITSSSATFDTALGAKLDLTVAPAVNPRSFPVEPGDDAYILQDLGFSFSLYGASFSTVAVSSNGFLVFRPAGVSQAAFDAGAVSPLESLAELQGGLPRIAPYWHDLDARASQTQGANGIYLRRDSDRVLVTWNNIRDYPNDPRVDRGVHRFQATLFRDGRIVFTYDAAQLTSRAITGVSPGSSSNLPTLVDLSNPSSSPINSPIAEFFTLNLIIDYFGVVQAFYAAHPNRDVYDFVYFMTDFDLDLGAAFAGYLPFRNDVRGIGIDPASGTEVFDFDPTGQLGGRKIQGLLNLSNIVGDYPDLPTTRIPIAGGNHALSVMAQEQGHRWGTFISYPGADPTILLGRSDVHWNFFLNTESTTSSLAARRSSSMEGNVWRENGDATFTSVNLIDGYSRLDHYLMGLRPASEVPDTFVIANPTNTTFARDDGPRPNITTGGTKQTVTINQIVQANGARTPDSTAAPKSFRAAVILLVRQGQPPSASTLNKVARYRLAWESYFAQSTDFLGSINTGLADQTSSRVVAAASAASFKPTLAAAEIAALFGNGLTSGGTAVATSQPLPTTLAGTQVLINGAPAPLFFASPTQVNFQVLRTTAATTTNPSAQSATATIEVISNGQLIRAGAFQIAPVTPAIFTLNQSGTGAAAAVDGITGAFPPFNATQSNGQPNIIAVFGTGLGADATDVDGNVNASVQATIDGNPVTVNYAGRAPGFTGLNQFNVVFPANITSGTHNLVISRNGIPSRQVTIAVR